MKKYKKRVVKKKEKSDGKEDCYKRIKIKKISTYGLFILFPTIGVIKNKNYFIFLFEWLKSGISIEIQLNKKNKKEKY